MSLQESTHHCDWCIDTMWYYHQLVRIQILVAFAIDWVAMHSARITWIPEMINSVLESTQMHTKENVPENNKHVTNEVCITFQQLAFLIYTGNISYCLCFSSVCKTGLDKSSLVLYTLSREMCVFPWSGLLLVALECSAKLSRWVCCSVIISSVNHYLKINNKNKKNTLKCLNTLWQELELL